jgi:hypothetical protein
MSIVDELVTLLGLEVDPKAEGTASGFGKILGGVTAAAAAAGAALVAAAGAIVAYAVVQAEAIDKSGKMADAFGINFEAFQELEFAAQKSGAEVEEFRMDLENLSKTLVDNDALKELGISAKDATGKLKSTDAVLMDIAEKFETLSKGEQNRFTDQLGLSPGALKLLQQGSGGLKGMREEARRLGLVLDETAKNKAANFQSALLNSRSVVDALGKSISVGLLPSMADALDKFTDWVGANREFISVGIKQVVEGVALGFEMVGDAASYVGDQILKLTGPLDGIIGPLDATQAIALVVAVAMGALAIAAVAATWPFILMSAAIGAVILIMDDLYSAFTGGTSVIGGWFDQFTEAFPAITAGFKSLVEAVGESSGSIAEDLMIGFKQVLGFVSDVFSAILGIVTATVKAIDKIIGGANPFVVLPEMFKEQFDIIFNLAGKYAGKLVDSFKGLFGMGEEEAAGAGATAPAGSKANVPAGVVQGASGGGNSTNNTTINVNGAGDTGAVANEVVKRGGLGQTLQQSSPGLTGPTVG